MDGYDSNAIVDNHPKAKLLTIIEIINANPHKRIFQGCIFG